MIKKDRKYCTKCHTSKPIGEFNKHAGMLDGHQKWCRRCHHNYERKKRGKKRNEIAKFLRGEYYRVIKNNGCLACGKIDDECNLYPLPKGEARRNFTSYARAMKECTILCPVCVEKLEDGAIVKPSTPIEWDDSIIPPPKPPKYDRAEMDEIKRKILEKRKKGPALPGQ